MCPLGSSSPTEGGEVSSEERSLGFPPIMGTKEGKGVVTEQIDPAQRLG